MSKVFHCPADNISYLVLYHLSNATMIANGLVIRAYMYVYMPASIGIIMHGIYQCFYVCMHVRLYIFTLS